MWRPGSEWNKTGAGAQHTLASMEDTDPGEEQGWPAQRHCTPRGPTRGTGSREAGEEGSSDVQSAEGTTGDAASRRAVELHRRKAFVITL